MWVPGHEEVQENEKADVLAKTDAKTTFIGPESVWRLPKSYIKNIIRQ